jgi:hypothetical protein
MGAADASTRVFAALEGGARGRGGGADQGRAARPPRGVVPVRRFKLDARNRIVRRPPAQTHPAPARQARPQGIPSPPRLGDRLPPLSAARAACIGSKVPRRAILLHKDHPALPRARREHARWGERERPIDARHRIRAEGVHGEAKTWHGLARAVRRG